MDQRVARASRPLQTAWITLLSLLMVARFLWVYVHHPVAPDSDLPATAWYGWADQAAYYIAAHGWAHLDLNPALHYYPSGYALIGALFVPFFPADPFVIPDLLCWIGSLWLFAGLGERISGGAPGARAASATVFALVEAVDHHALYTWEIPWTSTPAATATFGALLLALHFANGGKPWQAPTAALLSGLLVLFRPTDAVVMVPATALCLASGGIPRLRRLLPGVLLGFATGTLMLLATHLATHGLELGRYLVISRRIGFEWRLLPLRWVTLLLSPRPLYPSGEGFAGVYWFVLPGLVGIIAMIAADAPRRLQHAAVGGGAVAFLCLYLCYRDLHVYGLFQFHNQHYLKWTVPVFAVYALGVTVKLARRQSLVTIGTAALIVAGLSCWRAELRVEPPDPGPSVAADGKGVILPQGLSPLDSAVLVAAPENFLSQYFGAHTLQTGRGSFDTTDAFRVIPVPGGFMLIPLRRLPADRSELRLADSVPLSPAARVIPARQRIVFGIPCLVLPNRPACGYPTLLSGP